MRSTAVSLVVVSALLVAACGRSNAGTHEGSRPAIGSSATTATLPGSGAPITGAPGITAPTYLKTYPNPYRPSYDTIADLWDDSAFIFIAVVEPPGAVPGGYSLNVTRWFGQEDRGGGGVGITTEEFTAAHLKVGGTYLFFYAIDPGDHATCIVGGTRGVFAYGPSAQTLTRIAASPTSRIPPVQSLAQFERTLNGLDNAQTGAISSNSPPMCKAAATGLPS